MENKLIAIIRIRGSIGLKKPVRDTLLKLRLYKKNNCVIIPSTLVYIGMLKKIKDVVTWGEINKETLLSLLEKRGKLPSKKPLTEAYLKEKLKLTMEEFTDSLLNFKKQIKDVPGLKPFFKLSPPIGGFESKGVKTPFSLGGGLGYRKDKINDLLKRML